jgi:osmotically-inducible protein OsmY
VRSAEIDAGNANVETDSGDVTLTGTVRSWAERDEAEAAAWRRGATLVTNNIRIAPLKRF